MNNYRKMFPYLTITGLLLFVMACNPFPTNLHPDIIDDPMIIASNPVPTQPNELEQLKISLSNAITEGDITSCQNIWSQLKETNPTIDFSQFRDELGNTFLHRAAEEGNNLLLEFLLFNSIDKNTYINTVNYRNQTPLHIAIMHKHLGSIERLIAAGADPMAHDSEGFTPFHIAIIHGNLDIVERLTSGNNVIELIDLPTKFGKYTAIKLAYIRKHIDVLKYLMHLKYYKSNEKLSDEELLIALEYEYVDLIETLIKEKRIETEIDGKGILQRAAYKGYLPLLEYFIGQFKKNPNDTSFITEKDRRNTAAYQGVRGGHTKVLYYLLQQGANPQIKEGVGKLGLPNLLHKAIKKYIKCKQPIHIQDSSILNAKNDEADKKLLDAKRNIDILLGNRRLNVGLPEFNIETENVYYKKRYILPADAFYKAVEAGPEVFFPLLYHSYVPNRREILAYGLEDYEDWEPIHSASKVGNKELIEYLLSMNANANSPFIDNSDIPYMDVEPPLNHAIKSGNIETVEYLILRRASVNNIYRPLHEAVRQGHKNIFNLLLNYGANVRDIDLYENTLLHTAALSKNVVGSDPTGTRISIQDIIAKVGAKAIHAKNFFDSTPLHLAAQIGNQPSISTLLEMRADINAEDEEGQTPLAVSIKENNLTVTKQLIAAGANPNKFLSTNNQDELLKLILLILKNEEVTLGGHAEIIDRLIKKTNEITLHKLIINLLTADPQTVFPQLKCFCDQLIKEHNIQLIDCLAKIIADHQADYQLDNKQVLFFVYQLIELYGLSPVDCIHQIILSRKDKFDSLLYHLINKYEVSPLAMFNNAIIQGREDIVSLLIGPYYRSTKNIIIKQGIATNDFGFINYLIQYDKSSSANLNYIISQAIKLNKLDIVQLLITKCYLDPRIVVANVIKEIPNAGYIANMYKFVQDLMDMHSLQPEDFVLWAAAGDMYEVVKHITIQHNLSTQQLIDYAIQMNDGQAFSFLKKFSKAEKLTFSETGLSNSNTGFNPTKKQRNNNDPS